MTRAKPKTIECDECQGTGHCYFCGGSGKTVKKKTCNACQPPGSGRCSKCGGTGQMLRTG